MSLTDTLIRCLKKGYDIHFTNEGYNNNLMRLSNEDAFMDEEAVALPNDHLTDEKIDTYLKLMEEAMDQKKIDNIKTEAKL